MKLDRGQLLQNKTVFGNILDRIKLAFYLLSLLVCYFVCPVHLITLG